MTSQWTRAFPRAGSRIALRQAGGGYVITTMAGGFLGDGGPATSAVVGFVGKAISDLALGNIYFSESAAHRVRRGDPGGRDLDGGGHGQGRLLRGRRCGAMAQLNSPIGLVLDLQGNLYIADSGNNRIRMVTGNSA